jgi:hypothetical protein
MELRSLRLEPNGAALRQWMRFESGRSYEHKSEETGNESTGARYYHDSLRESCSCAASQVHGPKLWFEVA